MAHDTAFLVAWQYLGAVKKRAIFFHSFLLPHLIPLKAKANIFRLLPLSSVWQAAEMKQINKCKSGK
jgi:hypothetical protein